MSDRNNQTQQPKPRIYGPTFEEADEKYVVIPKGTYLARVAQGGLHVGGKPTKDKELIERHGPDYRSHMLKLGLEIISGGEASIAGMRCTTHLLLEGKAFWNLVNTLRHAKLLDTLELFKAYNNNNDDKHDLPCFDRKKDKWEQFSCLFLHGKMEDDHGFEYVSKCGHGLVNQSMAISVGVPSVFNDQPSTGWINFKPQK